MVPRPSILLAWFGTYITSACPDKTGMLLSDGARQATKII